MSLPSQPDAKGYLNVRIEPMTLEDIPEVMVIERSSFSRPWPERAYRYELTQNPNAHFVVARLDGHASVAKQTSALGRLRIRRARTDNAPDAVVGFAGLWMQVDEAHIATIAVHPDFRGRGVGDKLLRAMLLTAQQHCARIVTLEVRVSNLVAQRLYQKYQFEVVGLRKAYYQDNREDALIMTITHFDTPEYRAWLAAVNAASH
ncbi:MAG: ribosomal protein S18-alanine N-acetyltransferase [Anaerolineae bacterium]|nr:ribosomal protein S18-alanine N-acetyltransferase [Thermoflexales bacterium]MDW8396798.1 ribosomal protein S18-alanine N-acetyltransferase [Anaerolineae bacterium]